MLKALPAQPVLLCLSARDELRCRFLWGPPSCLVPLSLHRLAQHCPDHLNSVGCAVQIPDAVIRRYTEEWKVYAPGYVGANSTGGYGFLDHEFFKVRLSSCAFRKGMIECPGA